MSHPDDSEAAEWMQALASGSDAAFNELVMRWQGPVRRFARRYVHDEHEAEEIAQETFVRVYRHRNRYRPEGRFSTWLFTIVVNLCRTRAAKLQRWHSAGLRPDPDEGADTRPDSGPGPAESADRAEQAAAVRAAIQELPHDLRTAIILFEYEQLSYAEIASVTSTSTKAVEMKLYRARQQLRKKLARFLGERTG